VKFEVANVMGCCLLCRGPIFNKAVVAGDFDLICMSCAEGIAKCVSPKVTEVTTVETAQADEVYKCEVCGKEFDSKMGLLAHKRRCKGGESK